MQTPIDADEEVDFNAAAQPIEDEKYKQTELFHLNDYIPKALQDLMYPNLVSEEEILEAVYERGFFPRGTPFQNLPQEFVDGCLIGAWPQVLDVIKGMRSKCNIPFENN